MLHHAHNEQTNTKAKVTHSLAKGKLIVIVGKYSAFYKKNVQLVFSLLIDHKCGGHLHNQTISWRYELSKLLLRKEMI